MQCPPELRYAIPLLLIFHALRIWQCQMPCGYSSIIEIQRAPPSGSINLHGIVSIKSLSLWLDWNTSATTCNQLSPDLGSDGRVTVSEQ